jgi:hypothetical protein
VVPALSASDVNPNGIDAAVVLPLRKANITKRSPESCPDGIVIEVDATELDAIYDNAI